MDITIIIAGLIGLAIGAVLAYLLTRKNTATTVAAAEEKAQAIIKEAQAKGELFLKDKTMEAKERFFQMKTE